MTTTKKGRFSGPPPKPGVYEGMSNDAYHALDAVQATQLKKVKKSPRLAHAWQTGDLPDKRTYTLYFGEAVHAALLEPARYKRDAVDVPGLSPQAKEETFAAKAALYPGKVILAEGWRELIAAASSRAMENEEVASILRTSGAATHFRELVIVWKCKRTGLLMKAKLDQLTVSPSRPPLLVDVKTTSCEDPDEFGRDCWELAYDVQMAHGEEAVEAAREMDPRFAVHAGPVEHAIIAVHTKPIVDVALYDLPIDAFVGIGRVRRRELLDAWCSCLLERKFHGVAGPTGRRTLPLPPYALARFADGGVS